MASQITQTRARETLSMAGLAAPAIERLKTRTSSMDLELLRLNLNSSPDEAKFLPERAPMTSSLSPRVGALVYNAQVGNVARSNGFIYFIQQARPRRRTLLMGLMRGLALFIGGIMWFGTQTFAGPVVTAVSGTLQHGATITITGSGFGVKNPAPPIIWADFEDGTGNPTNMGQRSSWSNTLAESNFAINSDNNLPGSTHNVVGIYWDPNSKIKHSSFEFHIDKTSPYWTKAFVYWKRYFDFEPPGRMGIFRILTDTMPLYSFAFAYPGSELNGYNNRTIACDIYQGPAYTKNQWMTEEVYWQFEGGSGLNLRGERCLGGGTGVADYNRNGKTIYHNETIDNGVSRYYQVITANLLSSNGDTVSPVGGKVYMDNIYIDETLARVMICPQPKWSARTNCEIQIPSTWSDTSITATVNQGSIDGLNRAYLYVVDTNGRVNKEGYPLKVKSQQPGQ